MDRIVMVYGLLYRAYGPQDWWPMVNPGTLACEHGGKVPKTDDERFEIAVGAILAQSTSWKNVEKALAGLKMTGNLSKDKVVSLPASKLAKLIKSAGYYNQKAKKLKLFAESSMPVTRENLLGIWGIGPETADSILLYAYRNPVFVVDAYTRRIFSRLGLVCKDAKYDSIQKIFHDNLDRDYEVFNEYHALLVEHAKRYCRTKPVCVACPINMLCRSFKNQKP